MHIRVLTAALVLGSGCVESAPPASHGITELSPQPGTQVLVFSRTAAFRHASIEDGLRMFAQLSADHGFDLTTSEDSEIFNDPVLFEFDAVVFLNTTGDILDSLQQHHFVAFIRAGGGFVGIHSATDTEYSWPWYGRLVGGYFAGHPEVQPATLVVEQPPHRAADGLPNPWTRTDEWYDIRDLNPDVRVVLRIDESSYKDPADASPEPRPISWHHEYEGGRAFYTALGHTRESYDEPLFFAHVWGGLQSVLPPNN